MKGAREQGRFYPSLFGIHISLFNYDFSPVRAYDNSDGHRPSAEIKNHYKP
jgi:hypothetical protein